MDLTLKLRIIEAIRNNVDIFYKVGPTEFRIRCPICGDSQKDFRDAHCYLKCSDDPREPILFNCFKCNAHGRVSQRFLKKLNLKDDVVKLMKNERYARVSWASENSVNMMLGDVRMDSPQVRYIEQRLGPGLTYQDYMKFNIIWDIENVFPYITEARVRHTMPDNNTCISFISEDRAVILSRTFVVGGKSSQWRKIRIMPGDSKSFYTIKTTSDIFGAASVIVNIAEGIFDILSAYKNFPTEGAAYIATLGSDYVSAVDFAISKGFIGKNIIFRIYIDNGIDELKLSKDLQRYKWICGAIYLCKNIMEKDIGTNRSQIRLKENKI